MLKKISVFWLVLAALLITSVIPLGLMAWNAIRSTETEVERTQLDQLTRLVKAHALTIDERLQAFENATSLATAQAKVFLLNRQDYLQPQDRQDILQKYQRDERDVYGLDSWYDNLYLPEFGDDRQSNIFLNQNMPLTAELEQAVIVTEKLNPIFEAIRSRNLGTQWIYLTLAEGLMRLYPWHENDGYPVDWEPQTITFYTVADAERNPDRQSVWTPPYNDFAGAGLMVTNSEPIYDGDELIAVMSHDLRIKDIQTEVLNFKVGEQGFAFLLDGQGNIIAHKDHTPEDTPLGEELAIKLAEQDPNMASVVQAMFNQGEADQRVEYVEYNNQQWVVVFTKIDTTGWYLGLMQSLREIDAPALRIRDQVIIGAVGLVVLALLVSVTLAHRISRPIVQLSGTARQIEDSVDLMDASIGHSNEKADKVDLSAVNGPYEISNLVLVFSQMATVLQQRINELGSMYVIGQTIVSSIDYEHTLQTMLSGVQRVVEFDEAEILIVQDDQLSIESWSGQSEQQNTTGHKFSLNQGLPGLVVQRKSAVLLPTISLAEGQRYFGNQEAAADLAEIINTGLKSFLGIPLSIGERLVGVLTLKYYSRDRVFNENDQRQLSRLMSLAAIALDNALQVQRREGALRKEIRELKIEIDQVKRSHDVKKIVESDQFREIRDRAQQIRRRNRDQDKEG